MEHAALIPYGYCQCGCGQQTALALKTYSARGRKKGEPVPFIQGHASRLLRGEASPHWRGGKTSSREGYVFQYQPTHPRASAGGYVFEHILVVERAIGKPLPLSAEVHHVNENPADNRNHNLVVCQDLAYHKLLHVRMRARKACGNANFRACRTCKRYDDPARLVFYATAMHHRQCSIEARQKRRDAARALRPMPRGSHQTEGA